MDNFSNVIGTLNSSAFKRNQLFIETFSNRLHYFFTSCLLLFCASLVMALEWVGIGKKIHCVQEGKDDDWTIPPHVIDTYCFIQPTFLVPKHYKLIQGETASYSGVGSYNPHTDDTSFKAYYQWVPFVLFFQAVLFRVPHVLFKIWEGGKIQSIICGLSSLHGLVIQKADRKKQERELAVYFRDSLNTHNMWALKMLLVEFFNFINVIGNIYFVDLFLQWEFATYGLSVLEVMQNDAQDRVDPMSVVFPTTTKCSYYKYGPSGTIQVHDALCVLPVNAVNEKIYVLLWFWFIALAIFSFFSFIYKSITMLIPGIIKMQITSASMNQDDLHLDEIGEKFQFGDWKVLHILSKNMEPVILGEFLRELYNNMFELNSNDIGNNSSNEIPLKNKYIVVV